MFVLMRHPTKRIIDQFYYQQRAAWVGSELYDADRGQMSLAEFANSDKLMENVMVRSLCNLPEEVMDVTFEDLTLAKEILRRKFVVGIMDWLDVSIVRFEKVFGWWYVGVLFGHLFAPSDSQFVLSFSLQGRKSSLY